jgi:hypothetical protein
MAVSFSLSRGSHVLTVAPPLLHSSHSTMTSTTAASTTDAMMTTKKAIPIVCPGHTRPLAELHFCTGPKEGASQRCDRMGYY